MFAFLLSCDRSLLRILKARAIQYVFIFYSILVQITTSASKVRLPDLAYFIADSRTLR